MEKHWELGDYGESGEYDVEYEVSLDDPLTLEQAGKRSWRASDRVTDWEAATIVFATDVELSEDMVRLPDEASWIYYCDENCALYTFNTSSDTDKGFDYLAMYCWQDKVLFVLAEEEAEIDDLKFYNGKIYYSTEIVENVAYKTIQDGEEQLTEEEDTVGIRLNRMEPDGTGKETVFEYRYPGTEQEIVERRVQSSTGVGDCWKHYTLQWLHDWLGKPGQYLVKGWQCLPHRNSICLSFSLYL